MAILVTHSASISKYPGAAILSSLDNSFEDRVIYPVMGNMRDLFLMRCRCNGTDLAPCIAGSVIQTGIMGSCCTRVNDHGWWKKIIKGIPIQHHHHPSDTWISIYLIFQYHFSYFEFQLNLHTDLNTDGFLSSVCSDWKNPFLLI